MTLEEQIYQVSDEAWREALEKEEESERPWLIARFLEDHKLIARWVTRLLGDRDSIDGSEVIAFILRGGLEDDPRAAIIAMREYGSFVLLADPIRPDRVVELFLSFYCCLGRAFQQAGVRV